MYGGDVGNDARQQEAARQARIDKGMTQVNQTFNGFDDGFYKDRENAYLNTAMPDFTAQAAKTRKSLSFALSRAGLLNSGSAVDRNAALDREVAKQQRGVEDQALGQTNELRSEVERQRGNVVSELEASADPAVAANLANAQAASLRAPTPMQPLGNLFANFSNTYLANQAASAYNPNVQPLWNFGGGGGSNSSERIV